MRVVMFGYQTWGHRTLQALLDSEHEVVLVVTHPGSDHAYEKIWSDSVADLAERARGPGAACATGPTTPNCSSALKEADPDIIVANNWRTWIPPEIFDLPPLGTLNIHDSLLPAYAGFSPLIWALINGEREVGRHRAHDGRRARRRRHRAAAGRPGRDRRTPPPTCSTGPWT